jgi:hypothetical protein
MTSKEIPLTEEWLLSVGFKYREPDERQTFRHWFLKFDENDNYGLYIETTKPGWFNRNGEHIGADNGWYLWAGREHNFFHLRHIHNLSDIITIVEALSGYEWKPENHMYGMVMTAEQNEKLNVRETP